MKISSKIDYRNQQYYGTIRIRGEANPYADGDEKVFYIKVRNKDKKKCSAQVEQIIGQWQSSLCFTALFYDIFKRIKRKRMNPGKVMNDYFRQAYLMRKIWLDEEKYKRVLLQQYEKSRP